LGEVTTVAGDWLNGWVEVTVYGLPRDGIVVVVVVVVVVVLDGWYELGPAAEDSGMEGKGSVSAASSPPYRREPGLEGAMEKAAEWRSSRGSPAQHQDGENMVEEGAEAECFGLILFGFGGRNCYRCQPPSRVTGRAGTGGQRLDGIVDGSKEV
jgi:hypothetical protein